MADVARLEAENERLRAEIALLKGGCSEEVTLESLNAKLTEFMARSEHHMAHTKSDEMASDVHALTEAEEKLSPKQIEEAREVFESYDKDGSGAISSDELAELMLVLGQSPSPERLAAIVDEVDDNKNGVIDFTEFLTLFAIFTGEMEEGDNVKKIKLSSMSYYGRVALPRWIHNDAEDVAGDITGPLIPSFRGISRTVVLRKDVELVCYLCIVVAGTASGLQTYAEFQSSGMIAAAEYLTLLVFAIEMLMKFLAESAGKMGGFFTDMWNTFDSAVLLSLLILTPMGEGELAAVRILRLLRAVRILRAAKMLPKLTLVLETLIKSASSVVYIALFTMLIMYIFAIVGVTVFSANDPFHFGNLGAAMLSLYRIATLEDWCDIMYFNIYGCDEWGDYKGDVAHYTVPCKNEAFPLFGTLYFCTFVLFSAFLLLNLFIGVITTAMNETQAELHAEKKDAARLAMATRLKAKRDRKHGSKMTNPTYEEVSMSPTSDNE